MHPTGDVLSTGPAEVEMSWTPSVSVIVPVYNGAATIAACLESLLDQTWAAHAYEVIVVENGSTDETTQIVRRYPVCLLHSDLRGPAAARNEGIERSDADIVAFTDADCVADPDWIAQLVEPYADPDVGGVGGEIRGYPAAQPGIVDLFCQQRSPLTNYWSGQGEFLPHLYTANASYRRKLLNQVGGFDPRLVTAEDVDLSWRLQLLTGARLYYAPKAITHHWHRSTRTGIARQYRQYGFGEILLDTMYHKHPGYPRGRRFQLRRMAGQLSALPRYAVSVARWRIRLAAGWANRSEAATPELQFLIEMSNILGKCEALMATRLMSDAGPVLRTEPQVLIRRYFPSRKE